MSIVSVRFRSEALGKHTGFNVIHPEPGDGPFPVLMQLHDSSDDSCSWLYDTEIGLAHAYTGHPGAQTWEYRDGHVREALVQHAEALGIPTTSGVATGLDR